MQHPTERVVRGQQDHVGDHAGLGGRRADHILWHRPLHAQQGQEDQQTQVSQSTVKDSDMGFSHNVTISTSSLTQNLQGR